VTARVAAVQHDSNNGNSKLLLKSNNRSSKVLLKSNNQLAEMNKSIEQQH